MMQFTISEASARSRCTPPTIRYYEAIGLLAPARRTAKGRRAFSRAEVSRLTFIRRARDFGLSITQVRELLMASDLPIAGCLPARSLVEDHLEMIRTRRSELLALELSLQAMIARCDSMCSPADSTDASCTIFEDLARPDMEQTSQ